MSIETRPIVDYFHDLQQKENDSIDQSIYQLLATYSSELTTIQRSSKKPSPISSFQHRHKSWLGDVPSTKKQVTFNQVVTVLTSNNEIAQTRLNKKKRSITVFEGEVYTDAVENLYTPK